jgi:hypothetical protein
VALLEELYIHHDTQLRSSELCPNVQNTGLLHVVQPLILLLAYLGSLIEPHTREAPLGG